MFITLCRILVILGFTVFFLNPISAAGLRPLKFVLDAPVYRLAEARAIASQLRQLGVEVSVNILTKAALRKAIKNGDRVAYLTDWGSAYFDPFDLALPKLSTDGRGNFSFYSNPRIDELLAESVSEARVRKRKELFHEVQQVIFEEAPWVFGFNLSNIEASSINVRNFTPSDDNRINLHDIELVKGDSLVVGMNAATFYTFDPAMHRSREAETVIRNMFDALVTRKKSGEIVPELAESWEIRNGKNYVFKLRKGVTFHDGSVMTADDVVYTFKRILTPEGIGGRSSPRKGLLGPLASVEKIDTDHVRFTLQSPFPPFLQALVHFQIVPGDYIRSVGDAAFAERPIGTGPFRYVSGSKISDVIMERYDSYYGGAPDIPPAGPAKIRQAIFRPVPEPAKRVSGLLLGDLSIIQAVPVGSIARLSASSDIKIASILGTRSYQIELNNKIPPFNDTRLRKALNYAIDWQEILEQVYSGYGQRIPTCFLRSGFGYDTSLKSYDHDPALARTLIAEAGYSLAPEGTRGEALDSAVPESSDPPAEQPLSAGIRPEEAPAKVIIASSEGSAPFHFTDSRGVPSGMFIDLWKRWSEATGIRVEFRASSWNRTLENVRIGKADIHAGLFKSAKREVFLDYGVPLHKSDTHFFYHKSLLEIDDLEDLIPFKIGIIAGDFALDFVRKRLPEASLSVYPDNRALFDAVEAGEIRVFIKDTPIARYHLSQRRLFHEFRFHSARPLYTNTFYSAVGEGNARLLSFIRQGMDAIPDTEKAAIQRKWMGVSETKTEDIVAIALQEDNLPFSGLDFNGKPTGLLVDIWNLWSRKTRQRIEFKLSSRTQLRYMIEKNEADIHAGLAPTKDLKKRLGFSQPFYRIVSSIFSKTGLNPDDVAKRPGGKILGVPVGMYHLKLLRQRLPGVSIKQYADHQAMIKAALSGELQHFIFPTAVALNLLDKLGASGQMTLSSRPLLEEKLHAAVRRSNHLLLERVDAGLNRIRNSELVEIEKRWLALPEIRQLNVSSPEIRLTQEEQHWLDNNRAIRLGADPDWAPFEFIGEDGKTLKGMTADIIRLLNERLGISIRIVPAKSWAEVMNKARKQEVDVISSAIHTKSREKFMSFTEPYLSIPWMIITRTDFEFVGGLTDLEGKRVAVVIEYAAQKSIEEQYPEINLRKFQSPLEGLRAVSDGRVDAYVGNLVATGYIIRQHNLANLKVAAPTGLSIDMDHLRLGVRRDWPLLVSVLNKGLSTITEEEKNRIRNKWIAVRFEHGIDMDYVRTVAIRVAVIVFLILGLILLWNRRLKAEVMRRKKAEVALKSARDAAEAANRAKSAFLSNMSHEIRTPMNAILGFSQLMLRDESVSGEQKETLRTIWRAGEHLLDLINDILEMSKIEAGRLQTNPESFNLHSLLEDLEMMFRVRTNAKGIRLTFQTADHVPQFVRTDGKKLRQMLINLIGNAVKFTMEGGIVLRVRADTEQKYLTFEVEDSGPGISEHEIDRIFEQFEQTVAGSKTEGGTGLGLAISRKYAELLGGSIRATSRLNEGSLFVLELPVEPADHKEIEAKAAQDRVIHLKPGQESVRVLVVDDQKANRDLTSKTLIEVGFQVEEAVDGVHAIEQFRRFKPQLILMDIVMPKMDGIEATRQIRELPESRDTVIFAVTASVLEDEKDRILSMGAAEFIRKPYREADLFDKIEKHLGLQFEYEDRQPDSRTETGEADDSGSLSCKDVSGLPEELADALYRAAANGYTDQLYQLIQLVKSLNPAAAGYLKKLVQDYNYEKLMNLIECGKETDK